MTSSGTAVPAGTASTHVLDAALGRPARGLAVVLRRIEAGIGTVLAEVETDDDGRVRLEPALGAGPHTLTFATGPWFTAAGRDTFFPEVSVVFEVAPGQHHHVALLLSPFSYTTYRGS